MLGVCVKNNPTAFTVANDSRTLCDRSWKCSFYQGYIRNVPGSLRADQSVCCASTHNHLKKSTMSSTVSTFSSVPDELIELLTDRLPTSFTILRRLQSARSGSDTSPTARIVFVSDTGSLTATEAQGNASEQDGGNLHKPHALTVAYVDMAGGPDTQMWMYSTLEDARVTDVPAGEYDRQLEALAQRLVQMRHEHGKELRYPGCVLLGSVHSDTRKMLERCGRVRPRATGDYDKWLFREELLPQRDAPLPDGMHWDKANLADCEMVVSIATVPRLA